MALQPARRARGERGLHDGLDRGQVGCGLEKHQRRRLAQGAAEIGHGGGPVAQEPEFDLHERMVDDDEHGKKMQDEQNAECKSPEGRRIKAED